MGLDRADTRPAYRQVSDNLRRKIASGELEPGDQLPSISAITAEYDISPMTARAAIKELSSANLVVVRQGQGAFVLKDAEAKASLSVDDLADLFHKVSTAVEELTDRVAALEEHFRPESPKNGSPTRKRDR